MFLNRRTLIAHAASLALHLALLSPLLLVAKADNKPFFDRPDIWHGAYLDFYEAEPASNEGTAHEASANEPSADVAPHPETAPVVPSPATEPAPAPPALSKASPPVPEETASPTLEPAPKPIQRSAQAETERDPLVERLMASERRKAQRRAEAERLKQQAEARQAAPAGENDTDPGADVAKSSAENSVRNLATAFTRAIPYATSADPSWEKLPLGMVGILKLTVVLAKGEIVDSVTEGTPSPALRKLQRSTLLLLKKGRFALPYGNQDSGRQDLEVRVELSRGAPRSAVALGFKAPRSDRDGTAYFILRSGLRFDATVKVAPSGS